MLHNDRAYSRNEGTHVQIPPGDRYGPPPVPPPPGRVTALWLSIAGAERFGWKCRLHGVSPKSGGSPNLTHTCHSGAPQVSPARCWQVSTMEVPREMLARLCAVQALPSLPTAPRTECTRGGSGCLSAPVCCESGGVLHNCGSVFAPEAKVGRSLGRALWQTVDTGSYL